MRRSVANGLANGASRLDAVLRVPRPTRVLFAYEDSHRAYRDALVRVIRTLRPQLVVTAVELRSLEAEVERIEPHLVVSSRPSTADVRGEVAWYRLSQEPAEPSEVCVGGRRSRSENPGLEVLVAVVDQVQEAVRDGSPLGGCQSKDGSPAPHPWIRRIDGPSPSVSGDSR